MDSFSVVKPEPELYDLLQSYKKDIFLSMNCHALATVESFDPNTQTISATINYLKSYLQKNTTNGSFEKTQSKYPILLDVPVVILRGGSAGISFPIKKGDQCLILFNDRSIDSWFGGGPVSELTSDRLHDLSDGIALVGLSNADNFISVYDTSRASLYNGSTKVAVSDTKVLVRNSTESLNEILQDLIIKLKTLTTVNTVPGSPATLSTATIGDLEGIGTRLEGLLE